MSIAARVFFVCLPVASVVVVLPKAATESEHPAITSFLSGPGRPLAVAENTERNFGRNPIGQDLRATFKIKNSGARRLILVEQDSCCGSANPELIIPPGQTKELEFTIRTNDFPLGPGRQAVRYVTNDRLHQSLDFTMTFEVTDIEHAK